MLKGDIKISKKSALFLTLILSVFATANYMSEIKTNNVKVYAEEMNVGSVVFRMDDMNPKDIYGGTWELITGDASVSFGDGSNQSGLIEGTNIKPVPLPRHSHTGKTSTDGAHTHTFTRPRGDKSWGNGGGNTWWGSNNTNHTTNTSGNHSHTLTINETGVDNPTIDVSGAKIKLNIWKRVG